MSEIKTKQLPHEKENWEGYTLEQLRYMRAYTAARLEINKDRLRQNFSQVKSLPALRASGILGKVLNSISYIDLAMLAFKIGSKAFKTVKWFRRK